MYDDVYVLREVFPDEIKLIKTVQTWKEIDQDNYDIWYRQLIRNLDLVKGHGYRAHQSADNDDWVIKQAGFLLKETDEYILLSMRITEHPHTGDFYRVDGVIKIPKPWIRKRVNLNDLIS